MTYVKVWVSRVNEQGCVGVCLVMSVGSALRLLGSIADRGFRLPQFVGCPHMLVDSRKFTPSVLLGFTLVPRTFAECLCLWSVAELR